MTQRLVVLIYFKESGKFLTNSAYLSEKEHDFEIYEEVRSKRVNLDLPGLQTEEPWCGFCLIDPEMGVRHILNFI